MDGHPGLDLVGIRQKTQVSHSFCVLTVHQDVHEAYDECVGSSGICPCAVCWAPWLCWACHANRPPFLCRGLKGSSGSKKPLWCDKRVIEINCFTCPFMEIKREELCLLFTISGACDSFVWIQTSIWCFLLPEQPLLTFLSVQTCWWWILPASVFWESLCFAVFERYFCWA